MKGICSARLVRVALLLAWALPWALGTGSLHAQGGAGNSRQMMELYMQVQQLQREMMELRGVNEEQAYRIRKLERQRLADYQNLDQRLQALSAGAAVSDPGAVGSVVQFRPPSSLRMGPTPK